MTGEENLPWSAPVHEVVRALSSDTAKGLSSARATDLLKRFGANTLKEQKRTPAWRRFLAQFKSPVVLTLLGATVVSALLGEHVDSIAILAIVVINAFVGFFQESKAEAAIEALRKLSTPKARVVRNGEVESIPAQDLVIGDILVLEAGDHIGADARLIQASQLSADEALLTGESLPAKKNEVVLPSGTALADRSNMLFAGTAVSTGSARAIVVAAGMHTEIGRIAALIENAEATSTPLQARLEKVSKNLLALCAVVVLIVAALGLLRGDSYVEVFMISVSLAVAAIPEGLPAVVTLALAIAIRRMAKKQAIVRHLPAVETLGSTSVICTDKTGTLTTGKMAVRELFTLETGLLDAGSGPTSESQTRLLRSSVLCSNASISGNGQSAGDPTEVALLRAAKSIGIDIGSENSRFPRLYEWAFDSDRKRMSTAVTESGNTLLHCKGAPEAMLDRCLLGENDRITIKETVSSLSSKGRRVLAVARRPLQGQVSEWSAASADRVEADLEFLGLVSIADPPRPESIEAIRQCRAAGIRVVMITGDHPQTASAIAAELGIHSHSTASSTVMTGAELDRLSPEELVKKVEQVSVYARVTPEHKLKIIQAWKKLGHIVAMTGDGVNDAPALKQASIGVSMGREGTEVARQASSMILTDDNFATIVEAVKEGRAIFGNIKRTIQYLLSGNLAEIIVMLGAVILGWPMPLAPIHLLWINLVTDGLPSLALAAEPVPRDLLKTSGRPSPQNFLDRRFYAEMYATGIVTAVLTLIVYGYSLKTEGELTARTHAFSFLVFCELFRSFASRSDWLTFVQLGVKSNLYHLAAVSLPIFIQIGIHHVAFFQSIFKVHEISWSECGILIALTLIPVTVLELRKLLFTRRLEV